MFIGNHQFRRLHRTMLSILAILACSVCSAYYAHVALQTGLVHNGNPPAHQDLYPMWNAYRAIVHHVNPYSESVTVSTQIAIYGRPAAESPLDPLRFAYPVFAVIPMLPLLFFSYAATCKAAVVLFSALTMFSAYWWLGPATGRTVRVAAMLLALSFFPVVMALMLVQPTLLFAALIAASLACVRGGRYRMAGVLVALATGKPQLAVMAYLPLAVWTFSGWKQRKPLALWFAGTEAVLFAVSFLLVPGWFTEWLRTISSYPGYTRPPLLLVLLGTLPGSVAMLAAMVAVLYSARRLAEADLILVTGFSISLLLFAIPFQSYNDVLLLAPALWLVQYCIQGPVPMRRVSCTALWLFIGSGWGVIAFVLAAGLLFPVHGWQLAEPLLTMACFVRSLSMTFAMTSVVLYRLSRLEADQPLELPCADASVGASR
jgi:hypothetical protein